MEEHILQLVIPKFPMESCSSRADGDEKARDSWPVVTQNTAASLLFETLGPTAPGEPSPNTTTATSPTTQP